MTHGAMTAHLEDADLVRWLDGEGAPEARARWEDHLEGCGRCRQEADALRAESEAVAHWLAAADFENRAGAEVGAGAGFGADSADRPVSSPGRPRKRRRSAVTAGGTLLRAAAIVLVLAAPLAAIPAVRGWVAERVGLASDPVAVAPEDAAVATAGPASIRFLPAPGPFQVMVESAQTGGTLTIGRAEGAEAVFEMTGAGRDTEPTVSAGGIHIANPPTSTASYVLRVPAAVEPVIVTWPGGTLHVSGPEIDGRVTLQLDG